MSNKNQISMTFVLNQLQISATRFLIIHDTCQTHKMVKNLCMSHIQPLPMNQVNSIINIHDTWACVHHAWCLSCMDKGNELAFEKCIYYAIANPSWWHNQVYLLRVCLNLYSITTKTKTSFQWMYIIFLRGSVEQCKFAHWRDYQPGIN